MKLEITFKSGAIVPVDVSEWTVNSEGGHIVGLKWTTPDQAKRRLAALELGEIACVVEVRR